MADYHNPQFLISVEALAEQLGASDLRIVDAT
ncbi:MAG: sulfurtransferase, partial [Gammaproteobacteria bacterium]